MRSNTRSVKVLKKKKKIEKVLISKRILFKKIAIMHGKGEFSKVNKAVYISKSRQRFDVLLYLFVARAKSRFKRIIFA